MQVGIHSKSICSEVIWEIKEYLVASGFELFHNLLRK